jgi:hypothetical protein
VRHSLTYSPGASQQLPQHLIRLVVKCVLEELFQTSATHFKKGYSMTQAAMSCPKCQGEMVRGYVLDFSPIGNRVSKWNAGPPKKAGLAGSAGIMDSTSEIPISTFRCQSCGFLESYAREEFAAK